MALPFNCGVGLIEGVPFSDDIIFSHFCIHFQIISNYYYLLQYFYQMQPQKKRSQFSIQIRRKKIHHSMQALRSIMQAENIAQTQTFKEYKQLLNKIVEGKVTLKEKVQELKLLSWEGQSANQIAQSSIPQMIFQSIQQAQKLSDIEFNDYITIFINLYSFHQLPIDGSFMLLTVKSILTPSRQMNCLWFLSNIIYKKTEFSQRVAKQLISNCQVVQFLENRVNKNFQTQSHILIFNFFCCSFLTVSSVIQYSYYVRIVKIIELMLKFQSQRQSNFYLFSEALIQHADSIKVHNYEIFGSCLMKEFQQICKKKKTKIVKNYLQFLLLFCKYDDSAYEKFLHYKIFINLTYCLENRFPQVKILCAEISTVILKKFKYQVDIDSIDFFSELGLEFVRFQKYSLDGQVSLLRCAKEYFTLLTLTKMSGEQKEEFIKEMTKSIEVLGIIITTSNGNVDLLMVSIDLLEIFLKIDIKNILKRKCEQQNIIYHLNGLETRSEELKEKIDKFLQIF